MLSTRARWLVLVAAALLATAYVLPLWRVDLIAPQYPEGLGMLIRVNGVEGLKPNDLHSINSLNHYIGMKAIEPDAIPELRWMPWILGGLIAAGLAVAAWGRRVPLYLWGGALGLLLAAGLYDYWRWGYHYGHDIDQSVAIIKIPGMTYQPPLIGSKKLLNFRAKSWPASGGIALALAAGLVGVAILDGRRRAALVLLATGATACAGNAPRALVIGEDTCAYCRMTITDPRYGAQVQLRTGKIETFDSIDCMLGFVQAADSSVIGGVWVADAVRGTFVRADSAVFLRGSTQRGPMGELVAYTSMGAALDAQQRAGGTVLEWAEVRADSATHNAHGGD